MTRFRPALSPLETRDNPASAFTASGAIAGGAPLVEVVSPGGTVLAQFQAFENTFTGGVRADTGELDGDPTSIEVAVSAGPGGGPRVQVYSVRTDSGVVFLLGDFFAYEGTYRGGVRVAVGDIDGSAAGNDQIIVGTDAGGGPRVRAFRFDNAVPVQLETALGNFLAFEEGFRGGVRVAAGNLDGNINNGDELATAAGPGGGPRVRILRGDGSVFSDTFAFAPGVTSGVTIGFVFATSTLQTDQRLDDFSQRSERLNAPIRAALLAAQTAGGTTPGGFTLGQTATGTGATGVGTTGLTTVGQNGSVPTGGGTGTSTGNGITF